MKAFADHFSRIATEYAAYRPRYPEGLFAGLARAVPRRDVAWDCATGGGQAAAGMAPWFRTVLGSDASRAQVRQAGARDRVRYFAALAEAVPIRSGTVDLVTVAQALHWLELEAFYREARRVLAPGGLLAVFTYGRHRVDGGRIDALFERFYEEVLGPYWPPERRWVEAGYQGLPFPFREESVQAPPLVAHWTPGEMLGYLSTWSAVVRCTEATGVDPVAGLVEQLDRLWPRQLRRRVEWTLTVRAGR